MMLVTGATGLNGSELVSRLSARGVPVRVLVRSVARAQRFSALPKVEIVQGDMAQPQTLREALHGVDRAMLISSSDPAMPGGAIELHRRSPHGGHQTRCQTVWNYAGH